MSKTRVRTPTSRVRFGHARTDITPPVGIYHRLWGAARHDRATGVHRPLFGDVMAFGPVRDDPEKGRGPDLLIRVQLDLAGLVDSQHRVLVEGLSDTLGVPHKSVVVTYSHTHAGGWFVPNRIPMPGGELIPPYLEELAARLSRACRQALDRLGEATITYALGTCTMAANRDYWDESYGGHTCGYNPESPADDVVTAARVTDDSGRTAGTVVHYACHPTTLAWENSLISPDYVGALREEVERVTEAPCICLQGACGDLGPREGYTGDTGVADRKGRQVAFAALSALMSTGPPGTDFEYRGPVISGATLGTWAHFPHEGERLAQVSAFSGDAYTVKLPLKAIPTKEALLEELDQWLAREQGAATDGDAAAARDYGARAERARRWLARFDELPERKSYPLRFTVYRMGDAVWVACGGEPYSAIQVALRRRFPGNAILCSPLAGDMRVAYLLPAHRYGKGLYQEEPSSLAPGCLETMTDAIACRIEALVS